ncbi:hypothetical protein [Rickettsia endosymbiont of Halotydeus destructor]|uniref:hypothetical protein n=1 Tax=Rickettsia endosymbiont of Halotydeus destructor TaxID=2996754 RepID=UPI003BB13445
MKDIENLAARIGGNNDLQRLVTFQEEFISGQVTFSGPDITVTHNTEVLGIINEDSNSGL